MGTTDPVAEAFKADLQSRLNTAEASARAQIYAKTGIDTQNQQVQDGASAAVSLAQNGFNPADSGDTHKLLTAIEGGLVALGPASGGITVICAGAVATLAQVGEASYCPIAKAFGAIGLGPIDGGVACGGAACSHVGTTTVQTVLSANSGALPYMPSVGLSTLIVNALALNAANAGNCLPGVLPTGLIVDACVSVWNQTHQGPAVPVYVPPLGDPMSALGGEMIVHWGNISGSNSILQATSGQDPNVFFAFWPVSFFSGLSGYETSSDGTLYFSYPTNTAASQPGAGQLSPPRYVMANSGDLIPSKSTAKAIVQGGAVLGAGALVGGLAFAWVSGRSAEAVFGGAWDSIVGMFKGGIKFPGARETRRRRRR